MRPYSAQEVIDAIEGTFGIVTTVAERLGCTRQTVYNYIKNYVTVKRALEAERDCQVDLAEAKSLELIEAGDGPQIRFVLSRLGKERGWVERVEQDITSKGEKIGGQYSDTERLTLLTALLERVGAQAGGPDSE